MNSGGGINLTGFQHFADHMVFMFGSIIIIGCFDARHGNYRKSALEIRRRNVGRFIDTQIFS
jgi:hypothetical protein